MLDAIIYFAGLAGAIWLAIALVDMLVAMIRREWLFSVRSLLILTAVLSWLLVRFAENP